MEDPTQGRGTSRGGRPAAVAFPIGMLVGRKYGEDMLKITLDVEEREWWAYTEMDQCVKRDLDNREIEEIRKECGLDEWVTYYYPDFFEQAATRP